MRRSVLIGIGSLTLALTASAQTPYHRPHKNAPRTTTAHRAYRGGGAVHQAAPQRTFSRMRFGTPSLSAVRSRESTLTAARIQSRTNTNSSFMQRPSMRSAAVARTPRSAVSDYSAGGRLSPRPRPTSAFPSRPEVSDIAARSQVHPSYESHWMQQRLGREARTSSSLLKPFTMNDTPALRSAPRQFNDRWASSYFQGGTRNPVVNRSGAPTAAIQEQRRAAFSNNWGGDRFTGRQYRVFRNYQPQWHDSSWWNYHSDRIVFVTVYSQSFPFYFDAGYWYPAWGYYADAYYPYDGPIYCYNDLPPDEIIANVQTQLYNQGYYDGPIDGILGPDTRAAIADYQADYGLPVTAAIDEPTVESLGLV
jgi:hypothetical protein